MRALGRHLLSTGARRRIASILSAILPSGRHERLPTGADGVDLDGFFDDLSATAPVLTLLGMAAFSWCIWLSPPFVLGRWTTFGGLGPGERPLLLSRLGESDVYVLREMPMLFKALAGLAVLGLPEVQAKLDVSVRDTTAPTWVRLTPPRQPS